MTHATYLPNLILKTITATESRHVQVKIMSIHEYDFVIVKPSPNPNVLV